MKSSIFICLLSLMSLLMACDREFLEIKRDKLERIPYTLNDFQSLLNTVNNPNQSPHELGIIGADEYYVSNGRLATLSQAYQRNGYLWAKEVYEQENVNDWNNGYSKILYANIALEGIEKFGTPALDQLWNVLKGEAYFQRAYNHFALAQLFCPPYAPERISKKVGLPLRRESDVTMLPSRSTLGEMYDFILQDLQEAEKLLPDQAVLKYQPSKLAVYALYARIYLQFSDYGRALEYAERYLRITDELLDFNRINASLRYPFAADNGASNPEIAFFKQALRSTILGNRFNVDTMLLGMYEENDLRRQVYFHRETDGRITFKGTYSGLNAAFSGFATDEIILVKAECLARAGEVDKALEALNYFLKHRIVQATFEPLEIRTKELLLHTILMERRKELFQRGVRWEDLRRFNKEPSHATILVRNIDGDRYELKPNDPRYTWPLPDVEITVGGLQQNER